MDPVVKLSKKMSYVLRHRPDSIGATLDDQGWLETSVLLEALKIDLAQLEKVVDTNNKKRFEFNEDRSLIRASQGHSVQISFGYKPKEPPEFLYHGTVADAWPSIQKEGLKKNEATSCTFEQ